MSLPFQAVTFDMDATFVHDDKSYDHARFERILSQLEDQGVKVIVSSGNQYECLTNYFPDTKERLYFVSENGAHVVYQGQDLVQTTVEQAVADEVIRFLCNDLKITPSLSGVKHGYVYAKLPAATLSANNFTSPTTYWSTITRTCRPIATISSPFYWTQLRLTNNWPPYRTALAIKFGLPRVVTAPLT